MENQARCAKQGAAVERRTSHYQAGSSDRHSRKFSMHATCTSFSRHEKTTMLARTSGCEHETNLVVICVIITVMHNPRHCGLRQLRGRYSLPSNSGTKQVKSSMLHSSSVARPGRSGHGRTPSMCCQVAEQLPSTIPLHLQNLKLALPIDDLK
jgi:hypothetical protein